MGARATDEASRLEWKPVDAVRRFLRGATVPGGYLTLAEVDAERREEQLGRLQVGQGEPQTWLVGLVKSQLEVASEARFRLRRWGAGGKAAGSVSFRVAWSRGTQQPPARAGTGDGSEIATRLKAVERSIEAVRRDLAALDARAGRMETAVDAMQPIVDAAEQALLVILRSGEEE